jgi:hypothetical protein
MLGILPDNPDDLISVTQYAATPPMHSFGGVNCYYGIQVRSRAKVAETAHTRARKAEDLLKQYDDEKHSIMSATSVLYIGQDEKQRHEYTVNFLVFDKG